MGLSCTAGCRAVVFAALWLRSSGLVAADLGGDPGNGTAQVQCGEGLSKKHFLERKDYPNARCLDGSQGAYYFSKGSGDGAKKFYIYRDGGAFCGSWTECRMRALMPLGSAGCLFHPTCTDLKTKHMGFSRHRVKNPLLHNWNHVRMLYCDGMYYAGKNLNPKGFGVYFQGGFIMEAVIDDLAKQFGLSEATEVVIGGCSAGAISTIATVDWIKTLVHAKSPDAKVAGFASSGYFQDYNFPNTKFRDKKKFPYEEALIRHALPSKCVEEHAGEEHLCLISEVVAPYVETPLFMWESLYDSYMLAWNLEEHMCGDEECAGDHGSRVRGSMFKLVLENKNVGAFVSACVHHCDGTLWGGDAARISVGEDTPLTALKVWYEGTVTGAGATAEGAEGMEGRLWMDDPQEKPYSSANEFCKAKTSIRTVTSALKSLLE